MAENGKFWRDRLSSYGHTGWADAMVYAYDQEERLALIRATIEKLNDGRNWALDFGCGTGDFSRLLLDRGYRVCGYDPYVHPQIASGHFVRASRWDEVPAVTEGYDVALSVTALDHILDRQEALNALQHIRQRLKYGGSLVMLEYALDEPSDLARFSISRNAYQAFRLLSEWRDLLSQSLFDCREVSVVAHPLIAPSDGYKAYIGSRWVRARRHFPKMGWLAAGYDRWLHHYARDLVAMRSHQPIDYPTKSPLKLISAIAR